MRKKTLSKLKTLTKLLMNSSKKKASLNIYRNLTVPKPRDKNLLGLIVVYKSNN